MTPQTALSVRTADTLKKPNYLPNNGSPKCGPLPNKIPMKAKTIKKFLQYVNDRSELAVIFDRNTKQAELVVIQERLKIDLQPLAGGSDKSTIFFCPEEIK